MFALVLDREVRLDPAYPRPMPGPGEALIRVRLAGVCATDLELVRGYRGFRGVLGHEFVGAVVACGDEDWIGRRVAGEINVGCGSCAECLAGGAAHCQSRQAIGILHRDGAFSEYLALPVANLCVVPDSVPDESAVFAEPLAAALQILNQIHVRPEHTTAVVGDGKLGLLVAQVLAITGAEVTVIGHHPRKMALATRWGLQTGRPERRVDVVVECSGSPSGLATALDWVRPRGTVVLKSTYSSQLPLDVAHIVVDEIRLVGSRCGPFPPALSTLASGRVDVLSLIEARYPLSDGLAALEHAGRRGALKVLLEP